MRLRFPENQLARPAMVFPPQGSPHATRQLDTGTPSGRSSLLATRSSGFHEGPAVRCPTVGPFPCERRCELTSQENVTSGRTVQLVHPGAGGPGRQAALALPFLP